MAKDILPRLHCKCLDIKRRPCYQQSCSVLPDILKSAGAHFYDAENNFAEGISFCTGAGSVSPNLRIAIAS